jgi:alpha-D-xyloside xylohydrolase
MLGEALMVAPIFNSEGQAEYFLPEGKWTHFITGKELRGGRWVREEVNYLDIPLLARENSVIPIGANDSIPDYELSEDVTFYVFNLGDGIEVESIVPDSKANPATVLNIVRRGDQVTITPKKVSGNWKVLLRNIDSIKTVKGGKSTKSSEGSMICPDDIQSDVIIKI